MGRLEAKDFGYDFVEQEERAPLVVLDPPTTSTTTTTPAGSDEPNQTGEYALYNEQPQEQSFKYHPTQTTTNGGEGYVVSGDSYDSASIIASSGVCMGVMCCCLTICLVIAGGILVATQQYEDDDDSLALAGTILLVLAAASCLCACCVLCTSTLVDSFGSFVNDDDGSSADPNLKEIMVRFRRLNGRYEKGSLRAKESLNQTRLDVVGHIPELKEAAKEERKKQKEQEKKKRREFEIQIKQDLESGLSNEKIRDKYRPIVFLIVFDGDTVVSNMELLRKQVSLVVNLGTAKRDKCVVVLASPGGAVSQYGLAASQLVRIRKAGIELIVCVDTVAASGGYMMASVANLICAAPFAMVGSVGVVTHIPNFQRFLEDKKIDAYLMTAGKHKRTIDVIGEVTEEDKAKLKEELDDIHLAFKSHIAIARPKLKNTIEEIATGEYWLAVQAKEKGLVDCIMTSDEYLESVCEDYDIIEILEKHRKKSMWRDWHEAALSAKSVVQRLQNTVETPERRSMPMAIV